MSVLYFLIGLTVFWICVIALISTVEKRLVWPFVPASDLPADRVPSANDYSHTAARAATAADFMWIGTFGDGKGKLYRIRYDVFRSPDGDVLAFVGIGSVASIMVQNTWLRTLLADGRSLVTIDNQTGSEFDPTGLTEEKLLRFAPFEMLLAAHRARVQATGRTVESFQKNDPLDDLRRFRRNHVERLARRGDAIFVDREKTVWRYSPKGAMALAIRQHFNGIRRSYVPDAVPRSTQR